MNNLINVPHVEKVKVALGEPALQALTLIFERSKGTPPGTNIDRFRADHPGLMEVLNTLGWSGLFLKQDHAKGTYRISGYALPLIDSPYSVELLECMESAYVQMQTYYREHLREPLNTKALIGLVGKNRDLVREAFFYLRDIDGWWSGLSNDFPLDLNSTVTINEQVLVYKSFGDLLARVYEWNYVNPTVTAGIPPECLDQKARGNSPGIFDEPSTSPYPDWFNELDDSKKALLIEIDINLRNDLKALPMMGMRALLDSVMVERIGDIGGFEEKLKQFTKNEYVTEQHADILRKVLEAGHASMHRTYFPNTQDLMTCADVVKHLLLGIYILHPKVQNLAANTPPRPKTG